MWVTAGTDGLVSQTERGVSVPTFLNTEEENRAAGRPSCPSTLRPEVPLFLTLKHSASQSWGAGDKEATPLSPLLLT